MNFKKLLFIVPLMMALLPLAGCGDDDPDPLPELPQQKHNRENLSMSGRSNIEYTMGQDGPKQTFTYDDTVYGFRFTGNVVDVTIYQAKFANNMPILAAISLPPMTVTRDENGTEMISGTDLTALINEGASGTGTPNPGIVFKTFEAKFFGEERTSCAVNFTVDINMKRGEMELTLSGKCNFLGRTML